MCERGEGPHVSVNHASGEDNKRKENEEGEEDGKD